MSKQKKSNKNNSGPSENLTEAVESASEKDTVASEGLPETNDSTVAEAPATQSCEPISEVSDDDLASPSEDDLPDEDDGIDNTDSENSDEAADEPPIPEYDFDREERRALYKRIAVITLTIVLSLCAALGILAAIIYNLAPDGKVINNIYCSGIDMSGKTLEEVKSTLSSSLKLDADTIGIKVKVGEDMTKSYSITAEEIEMQGLVDKTADRVISHGRSGNIFLDALNRVLLMFKRHNVMCSVEFNQEKLALKLDTIGKDALGQIVPHKIVVQADGNVALVAGADGFDENVDPAIKQIRTSLDSFEYSDIPVTMKIGSPLKLAFENVDGAVYCDPVDAYYTKEGNEVSVIADVPGRFLVREECEALINQFNETLTETVFPFHVSEAAIQTEELQSKLFSSTIGSYATSYGGGNRGANVAQAARKLNGKVILPGETCSFNETVGPRTSAAGFYPAPEYVAGKSVMGIGGGTCQVSSTLYVAVLYSGLDIVSRTNHMMTVGYMPLGLDATVSYGGVDFKFRNNTNYPVKIVTSASAGGGLCKISIVGTAYDPPISIKMTSSGAMSGNGGRTSVRNYRNVYDAAGNRIRQDDLGLSVYMPHS